MSGHQQFPVFLLKIYLSLGIFLSFSFVIVSELFCGELLETFTILLAILLFLKLPAAYIV